MPKQGHFAKSTRLKQLNNFKVKKHFPGNIIPDTQLTDFLVARFALTAKKRVTREAQETVQRFLIELADQLLNYHGKLGDLVPVLLQDINHRAPWQFYLQLLPEWNLLQSFLEKEVPAVPLRQRCYLTGTLTKEEVSAVVARLLADKASAITFLKQPNAPTILRQQTAKMLLATIYQNGQIDWDKVRALLAPFPFQVDSSLDAETKEWLTTLSRQ
ncbi:hypothetical protein [Limosilactobacillus kribbianus]|uniref:hypothetical protein n=1 Tax=Limosilactobacillus kribbianus TaxID=2982695 RepID=UPI00226411D8|nr:hypothetical protein [Limosilactobacillus kribbianus]